MSGAAIAREGAAARSALPATIETLPGERRSWAIAAVHGEVERLERLHDRLALRIAPEDNLVYLGNFLGRGARVFATVQELLLFRRAALARHLHDGHGAIAFLRGGQEEMWRKLLQIQLAPNPREVLEWMLHRGLGATIEAYGGSVREARVAARCGAHAVSQWTNRLRAAVRARDGHDRLLNSVKRAAATADGRLLFVSHGIDPRLPLERQSDALWWGGGGFESMDAPYAEFRRIVRGLDGARAGVRISPYTASIDGGCGFGGPLIAACFDADGVVVDTLDA